MSFNPAATHRAQARVGQVLNEKWRLDSLLGIGGMATVYGATHRNGKRAALKMLHTELVVDPSLVTRFLREGYLANRVAHPGVVSVLDDSFTEDGSPYLVMELLEGYSLERHTHAPENALPLAKVLQVADELLDVLAAAHAIGIVHRDIKPANLFLTREGTIKVLDFGIARLAESSGESAGLTQTGAAIGTPSYMPPEQARGRWNEVDARTDLWAVGATMLALLLGQRPRRGETVQEELLLAMTAPMPGAASLCSGLPERIALAIDRSVAFERDKRFPDAASMKLELLQAADPNAPAVNALDRTMLVQHSADTAPVMHPGVAQPGVSQTGSARTGGPQNPLAMSVAGASPQAPNPGSGSFGKNANAGSGSGSFGSTVQMAEPQLTTGRPMMWVEPPPAAPTSSRGGGVIVAAAVGVLLAATVVGGFAWKRHQTKVETTQPTAIAPPAAVTTIPAPVTALPVTADTATTAASAPSGATSEAPLATGSASATPSAATPGAASHPTAPRSSGTRPGVAAPRSSTAPPDTAGIFDKRF